MAVNELERDYLAMLHQCDMIENVIAGLKMENETDEQKKKQVGNIIMHLEMEILVSSSYFAIKVAVDPGEQESC